MKSIYYNEIDPYLCEWLRNLIAAGELPDGDIDDRSIEDVAPADVAGYTQCHFFAGVGGFPLALRLAGWPESRPIWTGSCPCQPYSAAGKGGGNDDPRALWWAWRWLIDQCRPECIVGEQVASKAGRQWLAGVRADLDLLGYAVGAADLPAASVGAPHIRQRLYWLGDASGPRGWRDTGAVPRAQAQGVSERQEARREPDEPVAAGADGRVCDAVEPRLEGYPGHGNASREPGRHIADAPGSAAASCVAGSPWDGAVWIECADGKRRRIEQGLEPLAPRLPGDVDQIRAYGNAICPWIGAAFLMAYMDTR